MVKSFKKSNIWVSSLVFFNTVQVQQKRFATLEIKRFRYIETAKIS